MRRLTLSAAAGCMVLTGVLLAARDMLGTRPAFTGDMRLVPERAQRIAVSAPAPPGAPTGGVNGSIQRSTGGAVLAGHDPVFSRSWIDPDATYDIVELPFALGLDDIQVVSHAQASSRLEVTAPEGTVTHDLREGKAIDINGETLKVEAIRPWTGLLRNSGGTPAADMSVREKGGAWIEHQFIEPGGLVRVEPGPGLYHLRAASRAGMADAASKAFPPGLVPRWGVVEGAMTNWVASTVPGTGIALSDGRTVRLIETKPAATGEPAIRVAIPGDQEHVAYWVRANVPPRKDPPVCYEDPASLACVFAVYAWRDDAATVVLYELGERVSRSDLAAGEVWAPDGSDFEVRLDAVVGSALIIPPGRSSLQEAVLEGASRRLRIREDERQRFGDVSVVFRHESSPPVLHHKLTFYDLDAAELASVTLGPDDTFSFRGWTFSQAGHDIRTPDSAVLLVASRRSLIVTIAGGILALIGACGLWLVQRSLRTHELAGRH